jgi:hypothetical protein
MTTTHGGTQKGDERMNDNGAGNRKIRTVPTDDGPETRRGAAISTKPRDGAMTDRPPGETRGNRRHASEGSDVDRKKGS